MAHHFANRMRQQQALAEPPHSPAHTNASLNSNSTFARFNKRKGPDWEAPVNPYQSQALSRQRWLTLVCDGMETIKVLPPTLVEAEAMAREWVPAPPDAHFHLRVPVEYASVQASRLLQGPYLWINSEDTYQLAQTPLGLRMEIITDAPPPEEEPPPPPPPPVLEMPATFNLELAPGRTVALDTTCAADDDLDMSRTDDGTLVDGDFWGVLKIVHSGDNHSIDFSGTRLSGAPIPKEYFFDQRTVSKLVIATKPTTAKCSLTIRAPSVQYVDVNIGLTPFWNWGVTYPPAELVGDGRIKYFLRVHPDGYLEHFDSNLVTTSLYYEAMPDMSQMDPTSYISPFNGYAMPLASFIPHLSKVLDELHLGIPARTQMLSNAIGSFGHHKNIAYRFMPPERLSAAIDLSVSTEPVVFTRIFLMWRGVADDEIPLFGAAGEKAAGEKNWRALLNIPAEEATGDKFTVTELSIMECA